MNYDEIKELEAKLIEETLKRYQAQMNALIVARENSKLKVTIMLLKS